jgi:hypothetical protein
MIRSCPNFILLMSIMSNIKYYVDIPERFYPYRRLLAWRARRSTLFSLKFEWLASFCERPASTTPFLVMDDEIINEEIDSRGLLSEDCFQPKKRSNSPGGDAGFHTPVKRLR